MKKTIFVKLYSDIFYFFLSSLLIMGLIVWTLQAVNYFDFVTEDGHGLSVYFSYSLLNFPKIINRIIPFIFLVSTFYIILMYEFKNELSIFWVNGISKIEFLNKLLIFSILLMLFQIFLSSYLSPLTQYKARGFLKNSNIDFFTSLIKKGKFINVAKNITIFIEKENKDGSFSNIFLEDMREQNQKMIYAKKGYLINDGVKKKFRLSDGRVVNKEKTNLSIFEFDEIDFNLNNLDSNTIVKPKIQEVNIKILINCLKTSIDQSITSFNCEEGIKPEIKRELFKRIYKPLYIPLLALINIFLIINSKYNANHKKYNFVIFLSSILILIFSEASTRYFATSDYLSILSMIIPVFLFISLYLIFLKITKNV